MHGETVKSAKNYVSVDSNTAANRSTAANGSSLQHVDLIVLSNINVLINHTFQTQTRDRRGVVVKALRYKPADSGFDSRWYHWNFSVT
jgi:hypothetical protein